MIFKHQWLILSERFFHLKAQTLIQEVEVLVGDDEEDVCHMNMIWLGENFEYFQ